VLPIADGRNVCGELDMQLHPDWELHPQQFARKLDVQPALKINDDDGGG